MQDTCQDLFFLGGCSVEATCDGTLGSSGAVVGSSGSFSSPSFSLVSLVLVDSSAVPDGPVTLWLRESETICPKVYAHIRVAGLVEKLFLRE